MKYNTYTLSNGLRVIHLPSMSPVVYCGYQIGAGSRDEAPGEEGLAHFCEHVTFKGTEHRRASSILNCLESVGGDLNAYTNKEDTCFYAAILKEHVTRAIGLLTDIVFHSTYPQEEINKEVEVICDEIESYNDSPADLIYDEFENLIFEGHPLGHNILGTADHVRSFTTADALRFTRKHYRPDNAIFFIYGDVPFGRIVKLLNRQFKVGSSEDRSSDVGSSEDRSPEDRQMSGLQTSELLSSKNSEDRQKSGLQTSELLSSKKFNPQPAKKILRERGTHQAHVMLGAPAYDIRDPRRYSLYLLNNILGGPGMNARLNIILRERRGLVYTVESSMVSYSDTGLWCTYFGCDATDVLQCLHLVRHELNRYMHVPLTEQQLSAAKRQLKGQLGVACDNRENFALDFGRTFLHYGWEKDLTALYQQIDAVTSEGIMQVANEVFSEDRMSQFIYK